VYAHLDLLWVTRDLKNCLIFVFSDLVLSVAGVSAVFLLAERFQGIGVWSKEQVVFLLGYATVVTGVMDMFFTYNVLHISRRVGRGQLDHTLIQPQPLWLSLVTEGFAPFSGSGTVLVGLGLLAWSSRALGLQISLDWLGLAGLNVLSSCTIVLAFSFIWGSLAFWAPRGAEEISSAAVRLISQLKSFPLDGLGPVLLGGLLGAVPVGFVAWYPAGTLLGLGAVDRSVYATPLAALVFVALAVFVFRKGLQHYGRTGSQRYLSFGHRS